MQWMSIRDIRGLHIRGCIKKWMIRTFDCLEPAGNNHVPIRVNANETTCMLKGRYKCCQYPFFVSCDIIDNAILCKEILFHFDSLFHCDPRAS